MALHGHTKIELQDVNTGEKKVIEDDNMVTNGLAKMLIPAGGWANVFGTYAFYQPTDVNKQDFANRLLGGILCFEQPQEENENNINMDYGNRIVAKASSYAYTGIETTQGSYNLEESGKQENKAYKHVWDFATNQGNGTIASVSLTTQYGGEFGDGSSEVNTDSKWSTVILQRLMAQGIGASNGGTQFIDISLGCNDINGTTCIGLLCYADYTNNFMLFLKEAYSIRYNSSNADSYFYNSKKLVLKKIKFPFSKISVFCNPLDTVFEDGDIEILIPDSILTQCNSSSNFVSVQYDEGYIYFVMCANNTYIGSGNSLKVLKVNVQDFSTEVISIINTSPAIFYLYGYSYNYGYQADRVGYNAGSFDINNEYFTFCSLGTSGNGKVYRIKIENNTDVREYKKDDGSDFVFDAYSSRMSLIRIGKLLYYGVGSVVFNIESCKVKYTRTYNKTNISFIPSNKTYPFEAMGANTPVYYMASALDGQDSYMGILPCFKQDTLMTINNLPEPVIKTASQTMKITYTITEE